MASWLKKSTRETQADPVPQRGVRQGEAARDALQAHITLTTRPPYKKRLQEHLKETKATPAKLQKRIKKLGGKAEAVDLTAPTPAEARARTVAGKAVAAAQGPLQALRGTGERGEDAEEREGRVPRGGRGDRQLHGDQPLAEAVGDKETAKIAKAIMREEQRMAKYLEKLIPH